MLWLPGHLSDTKTDPCNAYLTVSVTTKQFKVVDCCLYVGKICKPGRREGQRKSGSAKQPA